jgi:hypothetical protein
VDVPRDLRIEEVSLDLLELELDVADVVHGSVDDGLLARGLELTWLLEVVLSGSIHGARDAPDVLVSRLNSHNCVSLP